MRDIKFRAWDKETNSMHDVTEISFNEDGSIDGTLKSITGRFYFNERVHVRGFNYEWIDDVILMQYTGLHDKNGKEIYEGDVLEFEDKSGKASVAYNQNKAQYQLSKLKHKSSNIIIKNAQIDLNTNCISEDELKVIGNIYENPELLEG